MIVIKRHRKLADIYSATTTSGDTASRYELQERDEGTLRRYWETYLSDEVVFGIIFALTTLTVGPGYELTAEGEDTVPEEVERAFERSFTALHSLVRDALIFGNGFAEIVRTRSGNFHSLKPIFPLDMEITNVNPDGETFYLYKPTNKIFDDKTIFNLVFFPRPDNYYGISLLSPLMPAIRRKRSLDEALITATQRHLPRMHIILKPDQFGNYPTPEERAAIARLFKDIRPEQEIVTTDAVDIRMLSTKDLPDIQGYLDLAISSVALGANIPLELLSSGSARATHATARIRANIFFAGPVSYLQRNLEKAINKQILHDKPYKFNVLEWQMPLAYTGKQ